jgi:altronate hydrolase
VIAVRMAQQDEMDGTEARIIASQHRRAGVVQHAHAGRILEGRATLDQVADELIDVITATAAGRPTASEALGHREFVLTYKSSEPTGPSCLPVGIGR